MNLVILGGTSAEKVSTLLKKNADNLNITVYRDLLTFIEQASVRVPQVERMLVLQDAYLNCAGDRDAAMRQFSTYIGQQFPELRLISIGMDQKFLQMCSQFLAAPLYLTLNSPRGTAKMFTDVAMLPIDKLRVEYASCVAQGAGVECFVEEAVVPAKSEVPVAAFDNTDGKKKKEKHGLFGGRHKKEKDSSNAFGAPAKSAEMSNVPVNNGAGAAAFGAGAGSAPFGNTGDTSAFGGASDNAFGGGASDNGGNGLNSSGAFGMPTDNESGAFGMPTANESTAFGIPNKTSSDNAFTIPNSFAPFDANNGAASSNGDAFAFGQNETASAGNFGMPSQADSKASSSHELGTVESGGTFGMKSDGFDTDTGFGSNQFARDASQDAFFPVNTDLNKVDEVDEVDEVGFGGFGAIGGASSFGSVDAPIGQSLDNGASQGAFGWNNGMSGDQTLHQEGVKNEGEDFSTVSQSPVPPSSQGNFGVDRSNFMGDAETSISFDSPVNTGVFPVEAADFVQSGGVVRDSEKSEISRINSSSESNLNASELDEIDAGDAMMGFANMPYMQTSVSMPTPEVNIDISKLQAHSNASNYDFRSAAQVQDRPMQRPSMPVEEVSQVGNAMNMGMLDDSAYQSQLAPTRVVERIVEKEVYIGSGTETPAHKLLEMGKPVTIIVTGDRRSGVTYTSLTLASLYAKRVSTLVVDLDTDTYGGQLYQDLDSLANEEENVKHGLNRAKNATLLGNLVHHDIEDGYDYLFSFIGAQKVEDGDIQALQNALIAQRTYQLTIIDCPWRKLSLLTEIIPTSKILICVDPDITGCHNTIELLNDIPMESRLVTAIERAGGYIAKQGTSVENLVQNMKWIGDTFESGSIDWSTLRILGTTSRENLIECMKKL